MSGFPTLIRSEKSIGQRERLREVEDKGYRNGRLAGGWLADFVSLRKSIVLCLDCRKKFDHRKAVYEPARRAPFNRGVTGMCDGCKAKGHRRILFNPAGAY